MFTKQQVQIISEHISEKIISINPVSGGDIANSYLVTTNSNSVFLKTHHNFKLLEAEKIGLETRHYSLSWLDVSIDTTLHQEIV